MKKEKNVQKVVHILGQLIPGGVEMRTLELIRASNSNEFEHYIYVTSGLPGSLDASFQKAGAELIYQDLKSLAFPPAFFNFLREKSIDVVHSYIMHSSGYVLAIAKAAGVSKRIANFRSDGLPMSNLNKRERVKRRGLSFLIDKTATDIVGLTPANLDAAWSYSWRDDLRCQIITSGIVVEDFSRLKKPEVLTAIQQDNLIVHVGRGDLHTKNREKALAITAAILKKYKQDVHLVFVGRDGLDPVSVKKNRRRWDALAAEYSISNNVTYLGERRDVAAFLATSDLFLFTSTLEGLPGVVLEARAAGIPIVSSDLPGVQFISKTFPDIHMLSPEASDEVWADAVVAALSTESSNRSLKQDEFRGSRYDFEVSFAAYRNLWTS